MHIVQIHNEYKNIGGEDVVVAREKNMLEEAGNTVSQYIVSNKDILSLSQKLKTALSMTYSLVQKKNIKEFLKQEAPDVVHVHNFLPIISPAVFYVCKELNIPVVVTIHNYRIICSNGLLYRRGDVCEDCINNKIGFSGIKNGCYQNSKTATAFPVISNAIHGYLKTWTSLIDKVIFLSNLSKDVFDKSHINFSDNQIEIKPNFADDNGYSYEKDNYALFVGRLSVEKGVLVIIEACIKSGKKLKVVGSGPLLEEIKQISYSNNNVEIVGFQNQQELASLYKNAQVLITGSKMYETFGLVIIESFSYGTPVIAPSFGNAGELVTNSYNGLHYQLNNINDLVNTIEKFDSITQESLRKNARKTFLEKYTREENLSNIIEIYKSIL